ncbi:polymeric immunoglobulin receptor-like isoform X2 [Ambystoma mexicanum]|uniref:polymeric immunoglobulin receptor-like isoform X2 n=1 Tax=Ambystoma mexicanum TaxID=8296 RepID=UPI0037E9AB98
MSIFCAAVLLTVIHGAATRGIVAPKQLTGLVDGAIKFKCHYSIATIANKYDRKFWCRFSANERECNTVVSTTGYLNRKYNASIIDSPENNFFEVAMHGLKIEDAGKYSCGIGTSARGLTATVNVAVTDDSVVPVEAELVFGQLRGQASIVCTFGSQHATGRKYLCKIDRVGGCRNIIDSLWEVDPAYMGRVMLSYLEAPGSVKVELINLERGDSGHYVCGAGKYGEFGETRDVDLRISQETTIPQVRNSLTAPEGGSIAAECHYDPRVKYSLKYWCKWRDHGCRQLITSEGFVQEDMEGRLALIDNPSNGTMTILMNQLTDDDGGWYWCAFASEESDQRFTVQVHITREQPGLSSSSIVSVAPGDPVSIPCLYPCKYNPHQKFWCKWNSGSCDPVTCTTEDQRGLSVSCDKGTREFLLSMPSASLHDEGWYWCGVKKAGRYGETVAVHLKVSEEARPNAAPPPLEKSDGPEEDDSSIGGSGRIHRIDTPSDASPPDSKSSHVLPIVLSLCAVVLLAGATYLLIRLKAKRNSDLVSVGSFRTNISLSELDNPRYAGKENPTAVDAQETEIGQDQKNTKKGSKEDLAYMSCLIYSDNSST